MIGGTNFTGTSPGNNIIAAAQNPLGVGNGFNLGYINGTITVGRNTIFQLGALVTALQGDGKSNILSTPSVLTLDNQEASIKVAQEVPFLTGQYTNNARRHVDDDQSGGSTTSTGISNPFQTIERKDVGLILKVTPHINEGDSVRMDIHQEVSNLLPPVQGAVDLVTNKREVTTSVLVVRQLAARARRPDRQPAQGQRSEGAVARRHSAARQPVPLSHQQPHQERPDGVPASAHPARRGDRGVGVEREIQLHAHRADAASRQESWPITPPTQRPLLPEVHDFLESPTLDGQPNPPPSGAQHP